MDATLTWTWHVWSALTPDLLYAILRLRSEVFVVEQNCVYTDMDGRDPQCEHLCGRDGDGALLAYLRLLPPGARTDQVSLGRVVVTPDARGLGLGRAAMLEGLRRCAERYPGRPVLVSAQKHLQPFYLGLGFSTVSEPYLEDGIWHLDMVKP